MNVGGGVKVGPGAEVVGSTGDPGVVVFTGGRVMEPAPDDAASVRKASTVLAADVLTASASVGPVVPNGRLHAVKRKPAMRIRWVDLNSRCIRLLLLYGRSRSRKSSSKWRILPRCKKNSNRLSRYVVDDNTTCIPYLRTFFNIVSCESKKMPNPKYAFV
jgi:hypothetical protein